MNRVWKLIKSKSKKYEDIHSVALVFADDGEFSPEASNCTCDWGSTWRWSKTNKTKMCSHIKQALEEYDKEIANKFKEKTTKFT